MYLLAPFIPQNFQKFQSYEDVPFLDPKWPTPLLLLSSTYWPFSLCKIFKNSYSRSRVMRMHHFGAQNGPFAPNKLISFSSTYQLLSLGKILKKFFQRIQSYEDAQFLGPKWPISPNENFFRKPVNEPCFFHSCLSTCQKSKSDINLLVKY